MSRLPPLPLMKETIERLKDEMCNEMATWTMDAAAPLFYVMDETVVMETILLPRLHSRLFFFFFFLLSRRGTRANGQLRGRRPERVLSCRRPGRARGRGGEARERGKDRGLDRYHAGGSTRTSCLPSSRYWPRRFGKTRVEGKGRQRFFFFFLRGNCGYLFSRRGF